MQDEQKSKLLGAFRLVLRPVVKLLLKFEIGYSEFAESVKLAFVDVATSEFGIRGRPTNISRVAVMTGLTRKEVRRLRTVLENGEETVSVKSTPMTEILSRWHSEIEYLDERGRPASLPFSGEGVSFSSLVKKYGGDVPPGAMRTELKRVGSVTEDDEGKLSLARRTFLMADKADQVVTALVHGAYPFLSGVAHNYERSDAQEDTPQFLVHTTNIDPSENNRLRRMCRDRLSDMAESIDDLFIAYETPRSVGEKTVTGKPVMVGLYYFEERDSNVKYDW